MATLIKENSQAPSFTLPDQDGAQHSLADYKGKWVLLYFYPKDDTSGCTKQACMVRDALPDFSKLDVTVLGVSVDAVASHKRFAEKYSLPFTLLADEDKKVSGAYGVLGEKGMALRTSFLIDPDGKVAKVYENVDPATHAEMVLGYFEK
jgi:peroxiredoxin Q/BCP